MCKKVVFHAKIGTLYNLDFSRQIRALRSRDGTGFSVTR